MALTPLEIHNKEFETRMRGFDKDEVNEFLDQVIRDYELLIRENKETKDDLELANKQLANYEEMQESLNKSIIVAQDAADRLKENTNKELEVIKLEADKYAEDVRKEADKYAEEVRKEADKYKDETCKDADDYSSNVHKEADDNADALLEEAVLKARKIEDETEALRKQSRVFRQRLQLLIESQLELLTKEEWDNLLVGKPIEYPDTETIAEVEKELEVKVEAEDQGTEDTDAYDEAEDNAYEETEEAVAFEAQDQEANEEAMGQEVAIESDEAYNNEDSEDEYYEEGTMPAVELPNSAEE
jgi:cell division initiation protein